MLTTIRIIVLILIVLIVLAVLPTWPHAKSPRYVHQRGLAVVTVDIMRCLR